ncbi:NUDIX domain-containing protein [Mammaliicoccus sciuri]|uniref:NUDIX domain-containing protein n=1 Tax=Mammaliicoccus sciuri TaxID=1296 RepID=UPI002DBCECA0|nr:NUDIX domain-containing protein [Mammaliicoccus sciuri]MEB8265328.1 NUDIX domain-containing protein [Mammaliicoccus sciuri]
MINNLRSMTSVYIVRNDEILLLYRSGSRVLNDLWIGSAGGHFNNDELDKPYDCIVRELKEELNISLEDIKNLTLRYITLRKIGNEVRQNYYYFAEINEILEKTIESNEGNLKWFNINKLPLDEMPITSKEVLKHYVKNRKMSKNIYCGSVNDNNINFSLMN